MDSAQTQGLVRTAQQAMAAGRMDEAAHLWTQVLSLSPEHPQALFHLGQDRLIRKDARGALPLLTRAAKADTSTPVIPLNLAFAYRSLGDKPGELEAIERALAIDPYFLPALLAKGAALERAGQVRQAARVYRDALAIAPPDAQLSPELRAHVARARGLVEQNARDLDAQLQAHLSQIRERHPDANFDRFEECKEAMLGRKKIYTHQPTMLHVPRLPAIQFYDRSEFPWLADLESQTDGIREELLALLREDAKEFGPYVQHPAGVPLNQWAELNFSPRWSAFFLWQDGKRIDAHCARCPRTAAVTESMPLADFPGYAPAVFFSTLEPHTRIPPHTGVTNARLIVHLPLIVPENTGFRVGNESRAFEAGKAWVFDDTIEHEAWNESDKLRVILIFDIWNPYLSAAERELVCALLSETRSYYSES
jgi:aspartyl/asparaginyl beta-hydroxylase (cupin superfamily)